MTSYDATYDATYAANANEACRGKPRQGYAYARSSLVGAMLP